MLHENLNLYLQVFFFSLESVIILKPPLKHGHDSHRQNPYILDNHIVQCLCRVLYRHLCKWKVQSIYNLEFYFLLFWQNYIQQKEGGSSIFNLLGKNFLRYLNRERNLALYSQIFRYGKIPNLQREKTLSVPFFSVLNTLFNN